MQKVPDNIIRLVKVFDKHIDYYKSSSYNEEEVRNNFINPLFEELGWDMSNKERHAPQYQQVLLEPSIKVGGGTKAPDYCFTINGTWKFFVEAKKPSENLQENSKHALQIRRYGWSANLPLCILTDFEEFIVYDTRIRPKKNDWPHTARIKNYTYKDYITKWDEISNLFSQKAVLQGNFDKYADNDTGKHGTQAVDDAFLTEIEDWREKLARNIANRNKKLTVVEINYSVQQIIDRIVFLRMSEDRGMESFDQLQSLSKQKEIFKNFTEICKNADEKYNSGLFHFNKEKDRETNPDSLTPNLIVDDKVLKDIKQLEAPRTWTEVKYHGGQIVADCGCYRHITPPASSRNDGVQSKRGRR